MCVFTIVSIKHNRVFTQSSWEILIQGPSTDTFLLQTALFLSSSSKDFVCICLGIFLRGGVFF